MKKPKKTPLMKKADALWSKCVVLIWAGECACCPTTTRRMNGHHGIPRSHMAHRYRLDNGMCLCVSCHTLGDGVTPHKTPLLWSDWMKENYPKRAERIRAHSRDMLPRPGNTVEWYQEQIERLRAVLKRLEAR
jgi:5-methylcytosine-specific restriction endonuclease McrA